MQTRNPKDLKPHPDNPREEIDETSQEFINFCADVKAKKILQPIVIDASDHILIGHRRTRAAIVVGLEQIPVVVRPLQDGEFEEDIFLAENMQRQDLSPLEEARTLVRLRTKMEQERGGRIAATDLARRTNTPLNTVTLRLCILDLPERVQRFFHTLDIPVNSSRELSKLKDWPEACEEIADKLVTRALTLRSLGTVVSRKLADLEMKSDISERSSEPQSRKKVHHVPESASTPAVTRDAVVDSLQQNRGRSISLFNVAVVLDSTCCNCGLMGEDVCRTCPLPKFVNGLIGRASGGLDE